MIKEILIALVAVVVVILIIAFAALRFLRADDSDTFDDLPDEPRKPSRAPADSQPIPSPVPRQRPTRPEPPVREHPRTLARAADRTADERLPAGYRDPDPRSDSAQRRSPGNGQRVPVTASRGTRPARQTDPDAKATASWDAMSDVDYWTELASEKPFTTPPTGAGPAPAARRSQGAKPGRKPSESRPAGRGDQSVLPVRQRTQPRAPEPVTQSPATQSIAALARLGGQPPVPGQPPVSTQPSGTSQRRAMRPDQSRPEPRTAPGRAARGPQPPPAPVSYPGAQGRLPLPLDDDPLTSPSFPAINTSDSRSYRTRRPRSSQAGAPQPDSHAGRDRAAPGYSQPAQQYSVPDFPAGMDRPASAPNGYPIQAPAAGPAANPYGSFVTSPPADYPSPPAGSTDPATGHLDGSAYGGSYANSSQPAAPDASWYSGGSGNGNNANGQYDASYYDSTSATNGGAHASDAGYTGADQYGSYGESAYPGGYPAPAFPASGYGNGSFQDGQPDPASYQPQGQFAGHYEQRAIGAPDLAYGQEGYPGYPGYGGNGR